MIKYALETINETWCKMKSLNERFEESGISQVHLYKLSEIIKLRDFTRQWISNNFLSQGVKEKIPNNLSRYHVWCASNQIPHQNLFSAPYRFTTPPKNISTMLLNSNLFKIFAALKLQNPKIIDEGMGWLGYRIIRPGMNDGYPMSAKNWGASKGAYSFWVPLFGFGAKYSLHYVSSSHKKEYKNFLPSEGKFTKDELRLDPSEVVDISSQYVRPGNGLFYHPRTLHTENVESGKKTRINLEFRFLFDE